MGGERIRWPDCGEAGCNTGPYCDPDEPHIHLFVDPLRIDEQHGGKLSIALYRHHLEPLLDGVDTVADRSARQSRLDEFAKAALPALIAVSDRVQNVTRDDVVGEAWNYAEAMEAARERRMKT